MNRTLPLAFLVALACGCSSKESGGGNSGGRASLANPNVATDGSNTPPPVSIIAKADPAAVIARVNGNPITIGDIYQPMMEAHGLQFTLHLAQLELARQKASGLGISISPEDVAAERQRTMEQAFKEMIEVEKIQGTQAEKDAFVAKEYARMMDQLLEMKRISKPEFALAMQTGAYLHKIAASQVEGKVSEKDVEEAFRIKYGEKVRVKHIQLRNPRDAAEALRRLTEDKQPFEQVAMEMSLDEQSKRFGGALRPFSRAERMWPTAFKEAAFALQEPGEISGQVNTGEFIHLLKLDQKIPPNAAVKFENHRDLVRAELYNLMTQMRVRQLRQEITLDAGKALKIEDPILKKQYDERLARTVGEVPLERDEFSRDLARERPATQPSQPSTQPAGSGVARPPATRPGI